MRRQPSPSTSPSGAATSKIATYRLLIEYEGTRYSGWQEQKNAPTVMGALLRAIAEAALPVVELGGAGRTDAGVHALAQCAHLRLEQRFDPADLCRALNKRLPRDVHVLGAAPAEPSFHARHDAVSRSYLYQVSRRRTALAKPWVWWVRDSLDVDRMRAAAALLVGRHDFRNFADVDPGGKESTLVEVESVEVIEEGALVVVRFVASHFLWRMVRRVVGTLVQVGAGHVTSEQVAKLLRGAPLGPEDPRPAETTAPPSGLFLERVLYAGDPPLGRPTAVVRVQAATLDAARPEPSRRSEARPRARGPRPGGPRRAEPPSKRGRGQENQGRRRSLGRDPADARRAPGPAIASAGQIAGGGARDSDPILVRLGVLRDTPRPGESRVSAERPGRRARRRTRPPRAGLVAAVYVAWTAPTVVMNVLGVGQKHEAMLVIDLDLHPARTGIGIDGLLGFSFLQHSVLTLDDRNGLVQLELGRLIRKPAQHRSARP